MPGMSMGMGMGGMGGIGPLSSSLFTVSQNSPTQPPADGCNDSRPSTSHSVSSHHFHTSQLPPPPPSLPPRPEFISALPSVPQFSQHHRRRPAGRGAGRSGGHRPPSRGPPTYRVLTDSTDVTSPTYGSSVPSTGNFGQGGYNPAFFNQGQGGGNWANPHGNKRQRQNE